ncbi:MAG: hypothetical protein C4560_07415 [Nitrospiraceae bacterium]|nr:MAG: hypothetical protein C4560_07415 [Nitrospiraceae bacterium]
MFKKNFFLFCALLLFVLNHPHEIAFAGDINIIVSDDVLLGKTKPLIFGTNIIAYDPSGHEVGEWAKTFRGYSNFGAGIWDPKKRQSVPEVIDLAKNIRVSVIRFPGASPTYNWKNTIGPLSGRENFLYGLDEFLKTAKEIGSEVVYTLPYYTGHVEDAADLVEYLNSECDGKNPRGGIDWANERVKNGHPDPYRIKYFELGNEVNYGISRKGIPAADPVTYANKFLEYEKAMKSVDPSILLGAVTENSSPGGKGISAWNGRMFEIAGSKIDFLIEHTYRPGYNEDDENVDANRLFNDTLASLNEINKYYKILPRHFEMVTGRKNIPIAITEYNGGFTQERPVPFRHALGTALFNAGLFQIFMKPENNILMANYWQFVNSYWGMIRNNEFMQGKGHYVKRPNYYTLEMFSRHFGNELVNSKITDTGLYENQVLSEDVNLLSNIGWRREIVLGANIDVEKDGTVRIEFDTGGDINFHHIHKKISVNPDTTYLLSGYLKAENLKDYEGVCFEIQDGRGWQYHNVTTDKIWGTTQWIRVETEYTTLKDAKNITVIIRRISGRGGPVNGKVYARDIRLEKKPVYKSKPEDNLMVSASLDDINNNLYVMVLNKNIADDVRASVKLNKKWRSGETTAWTLNGPEIWSTNEVDPATVTIRKRAVGMNNDKLDYVFPAHSLTSLQFKSVSD